MTKSGKWEAWEDLRLRTMWNESRTIKDMAVILQRKETSLRDRIKRLNLPKQPAKPKEKYDSKKRPPEIFISYGTPKTLLELGRKECHFPLEPKDDSDEKKSILFCGAPCDQYPYCKDHKRITLRN